jgi:uncharacterized membrane protein
MALNFKEDQELFSLKVDEAAKAHLLETMRWTKFLGILFIIAIILMCSVLAFVMMIYMPGMQTPVPYAAASVIFMSLFMTGLNFYPIFALLKFSTLIRSAIADSNQQQFNHALKYLKNMFRYIGVLTITLITIYGLGFGLSLLER